MTRRFDRLFPPAHRREDERLRWAEAHLWALVAWFGGREHDNPYAARDVAAAEQYVKRYCADGRDMRAEHHAARAALSRTEDAPDE